MLFRHAIYIYMQLSKELNQSVARARPTIISLLKLSYNLAHSPE